MRNMRKEELVHIHTLLALLKKYCEDTGLDCDFQKYNGLEISPYQVQRSKVEHKQAVFVLGNELAAGARTILEKNRISKNSNSLFQDEIHA